jgi:hypothetical protein
MKKRPTRIRVDRTAAPERDRLCESDNKFTPAGAVGKDPGDFQAEFLSRD